MTKLILKPGEYFSSYKLIYRLYLACTKSTVVTVYWSLWLKWCFCLGYTCDTLLSTHITHAEEKNKNTCPHTKVNNVADIERWAVTGRIWTGNEKLSSCLRQNTLGYTAHTGKSQYSPCSDAGRVKTTWHAGPYTVVCLSYSTYAQGSACTHLQHKAVYLHKMFGVASKKHFQIYTWPLHPLPLYGWGKILGFPSFIY